jgi:predicted membrane-bound dolichyl-phosphate-mannose-protein mannosyltransferase
MTSLYIVAHSLGFVDADHRVLTMDQQDANQAPSGHPSLQHPAAAHSALTVLSPHDQAIRQRALILKIVRGVFAVMVTTFTALAIYNALSSATQAEGAAMGLPTSTWVVGATSLLMIAMVLAIDKLTRYKKISTIAGTMLGALAGLLATLALGGLLDLLLQSWVPEKSVRGAAADHFRSSSSWASADVPGRHHSAADAG